MYILFLDLILFISIRAFIVVPFLEAIFSSMSPRFTTYTDGIAGASYPEGIFSLWPMYILFLDLILLVSIRAFIVVPFLEAIFSSMSPRFTTYTDGFTDGFAGRFLTGASEDNFSL